MRYLCKHYDKCPISSVYKVSKRCGISRGKYWLTDFPSFFLNNRQFQRIAIFKKNKYVEKPNAMAYMKEKG